LIESSRPDHRRYVEALGVVLVHELMAEPPRETQTAEANIHGGPRRRGSDEKTVAYIEQHLAEPISLEVLAQMAGLSRNYFLVAPSVQSFGIPPKRYQLESAHRKRRQEPLLGKARRPSVTDIGGSVGYNDHQRFSSTAFRRGHRPGPRRAYRRKTSVSQSQNYCVGEYVFTETGHSIAHAPWRRWIPPW